MKLYIRYKVKDRKLNEELEKNSKKFNNFTIADKNTIVTDKAELKKRKNTLYGIVNRIKDLPETEFYIDEKKLTSNEVLTLLEAYRKETKDIFDLIERVDFNTDKASYKPKWYSFGKFRNNIWEVDKEKIKSVVNVEIKEKNLDFYPNFSIETIERRINNLPATINPSMNPDWEYITDNTTRLGEFVGVRPRGKDSNNPFLDNPLGSLFNMFSDMDFGGDSFSFDNLFSGEAFGSTGSHKSSSDRDIPKTTFNDVGGMEPIIKQVREVIELPIVSPELLNYYSIKPHKGILLYGPPGCGKTLLAKAVANEINAHFITINGPEVLNKYVGQSEENLRKVFDEAVKKAPSIIYFDEFDSLATHRNEELDPYNARVVNQILTLLDGMEETSRVCVIASTNRLDMIDEAVKRPGRFDYILEVAKPTLEGCKEIFNIYTRDMPLDPNFDKDTFAQNYLSGCTGADISYIATEAAYNSIRRTININDLLEGDRFESNKSQVINEEDFVKAAQSLKKK